jgi:hypothetical protein
MFAGRLVVSRTTFHPMTPSSLLMGSGPYPRRFGDYHFCCLAINPGTGVEEVDRLGKRDDHTRHVVAQTLNRPVDGLEVGEQFAESTQCVGESPPLSAFRNAGNFLRSVARASSAKRSGSGVPPIRALSIARPETPKMSVARNALPRTDLTLMAYVNIRAAREIRR